MKNPNSNMNYSSMIAVDAWKLIFHSISRLTTIQKDLGGENVKALDELNRLAEDVKERITGKPVEKLKLGETSSDYYSQPIP
ncbi:MAG: hypothetical protein FWD97_07405 [Defluviitaleaceae bacterium]|nr:hypothetical protein [Defluviitaleaceae bacterium]